MLCICKALLGGVRDEEQGSTDLERSPDFDFHGLLGPLLVI